MNKSVLVLGFALVFSISACAGPMNRTQSGTGIGAGVGAAVGAGLGQAIGRDTTSTLIGMGAGAVAGGLAGGMIGNYMDKQEAALQQSFAASRQAANMVSVQRQQDNIMVNLKSDYLFSTGSANLSPGAYEDLERAATVMNQYPQTYIRVEGHTDATGSPQSNQQLSEQRAQAVANALMARGVAPARIQTVGYGATRPIAPNNTDSGKQMNRRVTMVIIPMQQG